MDDLLKQSMGDLFDAISWRPNGPRQLGKRRSETSSVDGEDYLTQALQGLDQGPFLYPNWQQSNDQPGMSSGVVSNQTNASTVQASPHPNTSKASTLKRSVSNLSESDRERKRRTDQAYRERLKKRNESMQLNLKLLTGENEYVKEENQSLKRDNASMNQTLRDQAKEIDCLRNNLSRLRSEYEKQNVLVQTLSGLLADPVQLEIEKLKTENASLRQNASFCGEVTLLAEENEKLKIENKVLKVQNDALCGKIISDNGKKREIEQEVCMNKMLSTI